MTMCTCRNDRIHIQLNLVAVKPSKPVLHLQECRLCCLLLWEKWLTTRSETEFGECVPSKNRSCNNPNWNLHETCRYLQFKWLGCQVWSVSLMVQTIRMTVDSINNGSLFSCRSDYQVAWYVPGIQELMFTNECQKSKIIQFGIRLSTHPDGRNRPTAVKQTGHQSIHTKWPFRETSTNVLDQELVGAAAKVPTYASCLFSA